jgi:hypothetical protein
MMRKPRKLNNRPESLRERFRQPPQVVAPRKPLQARPLRLARPPVAPLPTVKKPLPPHVESPESGDDWRDAWHFLQDRWEELRTHPFALLSAIWDRLLRWWDKE